MAFDLRARELDLHLKDGLVQAGFARRLIHRGLLSQPGVREFSCQRADVYGRSLFQFGWPIASWQILDLLDGWAMQDALSIGEIWTLVAWRCWGGTSPTWGV
jgi:hypothetical protein